MYIKQKYLSEWLQKCVSIRFEIFSYDELWILIMTQLLVWNVYKCSILFALRKAIDHAFNGRWNES